MQFNMYQWVKDTIAAPVKKPIPVLSFPAIQKMNVPVDVLVRDSDLQVEGMQIIADNFDTGAALAYMDLSVEAEAFGSTIRYTAEEVPTVVGAIIEEPEEADALEIPEIGAGRTGNCIESVKKAVAQITDRPVFGGIIGPFSLAGRLLDVSEAMYYCFDEPEMVHTVLEKVTAFQIAYCSAYKEAGAAGVVMAEPLAGLLSGGLAEEFSAAYVRKLVDAVQDEHFLVVYHNCGNSVIRTADTIFTNGCKVYHFGNAIDMAELMPKVPADLIAMGNIDPSSQFRNGTPESIREATAALMEACGSYPNFVPSSGCDIPPMSPWENIQAFFETVENYYKKA